MKVKNLSYSLCVLLGQQVQPWQEVHQIQKPLLSYFLLFLEEFVMLRVQHRLPLVHRMYLEPFVHDGEP